MPDSSHTHDFKDGTCTVCGHTKLDLFDLMTNQEKGKYTVAALYASGILEEFKKPVKCECCGHVDHEWTRAIEWCNQHKEEVVDAMLSEQTKGGMM